MFTKNLHILVASFCCGVISSYADITESFGESKYLVAVRKGIPICGGTIVSTRHVLTAGRCVFGEDAYYLSILAGVSNLADSDGVTIRVLSYVLHPGYHGPYPTVDYLENNIAVLKLTASLDLTNPNIGIAKLPKLDLKSGTIGISAGWGIDTTEKPSLDLHKSIIKVLPLSQCQQNNVWHTKEQFCGADDGTKAKMCDGDSGGPLIVNDTVVGVISVTTCNYGTVTYTKVYYHLSFIGRALRL